VYFDVHLQDDMPRRSYTYREEARENDFIQKCCKFSLFIGRDDKICKYNNINKYRLLFLQRAAMLALQALY